MMGRGKCVFPFFVQSNAVRMLKQKNVCFFMNKKCQKLGSFFYIFNLDWWKGR